MKGRTPTAEERRWMDAAGQLGCIACRTMGIYQPEISLHHIDGRTKPGAHLMTIPLCYQHHQGGLGEGPFISVHPWKARFEEAYGSQRDLLAECQRIVEGMN